MKLVFLDFDGVINSAVYFTDRANGLLEGVELDEYIDRRLTARVQRLCEETGAQIVVSSAWRVMRSVEVLREILTKHGVSAPVIGKTPHLGTYRGEEIQKWIDSYDGGALDACGIEGIVILDDMLGREFVHLSEWHVRTLWATGITDADVEKAKEVLQKAAPGRRAA